MKALTFIVLAAFYPVYILIEFVYLCFQLSRLSFEESKVFEAYEPIVFLRQIEKRKAECINDFKKATKNYFLKL